MPCSTVVKRLMCFLYRRLTWFNAGNAARGHTALLIAAEFVVPFRKGGKNDTAAIAARQPTMRFVPIKTVDQQAILA
jgi:hypothetical protein